MGKSPDSNGEKNVREKLILQLYVSGMSAKSMLAIGNIKRVCEKYVKGGFELEVIDIYKNPSLASEQQIVFSPSLVKLLPLPKKVFIGSLSDTNKLIRGLGITINEL